MSNNIFIRVLTSYKFKEVIHEDPPSELFKYYELIFKGESSPYLTLYWYNDDTFKLYRSEGFASVKLCDDKINLYNLKLGIEKNLPNDFLKLILND